MLNFAEQLLKATSQNTTSGLVRAVASIYSYKCTGRLPQKAEPMLYKPLSNNHQ